MQLLLFLLHLDGILEDKSDDADNGNHEDFFERDIPFLRFVWNAFVPLINDSTKINTENAIMYKLFVLLLLLPYMPLFYQPSRSEVCVCFLFLFLFLFLFSFRTLVNNTKRRLSGERKQTREDSEPHFHRLFLPLEV